MSGVLIYRIPNLEVPSANAAAFILSLGHRPQDPCSHDIQRCKRNLFHPHFAEETMALIPMNALPRTNRTNRRMKRAFSAPLCTFSIPGAVPPGWDEMAPLALDHAKTLLGITVILLAKATITL